MNAVRVKRVAQSKEFATRMALSAVVLVLVIAAMTARSIGSLVRDGRWVAHTHRVIETLDGLMLQARGMEAEARGFSSSAEVRRLDATSARDSAHVALDTLRGLVADNAEQIRSASSLRRLFDIDPARMPPVAIDGAGGRSGGGAAGWMASVRDTILVMRARETTLLATRSESEAASLRHTEIIGGLGLLVAVVLAVTAVVLARRTVDFLAESRRTSRYVATLIDSIGDGIYGLDDRGRITFVNRALARTLGVEPSEIIGRGAHETFHHSRADGTPYPVADCPMYGVAAGRTAVVASDELIWRRDGSAIPVEYSASPVIDPQGRHGAVVSVRDITERKWALDALRRGKEEAERANLAKSDFLARMSHELRTPLNSVIGFANVLLKNRGGTLSEQEMLYAGRIQGNGVHLLGLINSILDLSKIEAGRMEIDVEPVDVGAMIRELPQELETQAAANGVELRVAAPAALGVIHTDRVKLRQILLNLADNAVKFTKNGRVDVTLVADVNRAMPRRIEVRDTGIGIPADRLNAIFDPFEQGERSTTRRYGGTGLGLPISRSLAQLLGFELTVHSVDGEGTTFVLDLDPHGRRSPVSPIAAVDRVELAVGAGAVMHGRRVLVIDDDPGARALIERIVSELGGHTLVAEGGDVGLRVAESERPDLIILDLIMPGLSGRDVLRRLQSDRALRQIPVVAVSVEIGDRVAAMHGAVAVLAKPLDEAALARALKQALGAGRVLVVDDDADTRRLLTTFAYEEGAAEVRTADDGVRALALADDFAPDLILLDVVMPGLDGMTLLDRLADERTSNNAKRPPADRPAVIVVSSREFTADELRGLNGRALAVLQKGAELETALRSALRRYVGARRARTSAPGGAA